MRHLTQQSPRTDALSEVGESSKLGLRDLFLAHHASVWRLLRRLGVPMAQADDAAQEVFWVAARRLADISPGSEHAFLYGVAIRVAATERRRGKHSAMLYAIDQVPEPRCAERDPEQQLAGKQARELLDEVLDHMSDAARTVFVLYELEALELQDIAQVLDLPRGTVSSRLRRARDEFSQIAARVRAALQRQEGS